MRTTRAKSKQAFNAVASVKADPVASKKRKLDQITNGPSATANDTSNKRKKINGSALPVLNIVATPSISDQKIKIDTIQGKPKRALSKDKEDSKEEEKKVEVKGT